MIILTREKIPKRAASEWSVSKLMALILLVVLIVLVVYGISSGAFKPAYEKIKGKFDWVLDLFGLKTQPGNTFSRQAVVNGNSGLLTFSENGEWCKIDFDNTALGSYEYNFNTNALRKWQGNSWSNPLVYADSGKVWTRDIYWGFRNSFDNLKINFEGEKKPGYDSYIGLTLETSGGVYGFGRDFKGKYNSEGYLIGEEYSSSNIVLWRYNPDKTGSDAWEEISRKDLDKADAWKWNLYKAFKSLLENPFDSGFNIEVGDTQYGLRFATVDVYSLDKTKTSEKTILYRDLGNNQYYGYDPKTKEIYYSDEAPGTNSFAPRVWRSIVEKYMAESESNWNVTKENEKIRQGLIQECR